MGVFSNGDLEFIAGFGKTSDEKKLARQLLAERSEREKNPGVWDDAPEWANEAWVQWRDGTRDTSNFHGQWREKPYTRTLPKTKAREIAEKYFTSGAYVTTCESAILEALQSEVKK